MRSPRWPIRLRLTALYATAFAAAGLALVTVTYWLVSQSLDQHGDSTRTHLDSDPELAEVVRRQIAAYRGTTLDRLLAWSTLALVVALVLAVVLGWALAGRALRPLHQVTATATRIADRNLHERIALSGPDDEVKELADTIDEMLERLDRSFDAQRRFVANASHELRTPLTVNRTMLEVAVADPDASDDLRQLAPKLLATNERSERLVDGLLTLARTQLLVAERTPLDLAAVLTAALDHEQSEARHRAVQTTADLQPAPITGNPLLVERLAANLVQNVLRHSPSGSTALISTGRRDGQAVVRTENPGPVVRADQVAELFEPFRRGHERTSSAGLGLGLSIVRAVAQAHGGTATARPRPSGGLVVEVALPSTGLAPDR